LSSKSNAKSISSTKAGEPKHKRKKISGDR
jgi:hypothetical protein